ncbi:alkaline phosphatase family protein [Yinghuangia soli]|uniref:Alkaline phosphatase family protein n=1 Tax=Yinghuangia soli TaxID=2908204 RepID=A0AA41PV14_9ACTN|nr:nucleotide pyrophosphatase/phosphodiesterase family protein [Yinghuangia soli]MCF2526388.1 alkaline phosphatase family protein [Yinghuangia soli]
MSAAPWPPAPPPVPVPRYGAGALSDLLPSVAAALGMPDEDNVLGLRENAKAVVFLVDGLGWELLKAHPDWAPFLASLIPGSWGGRGPITAGFPATTATSLASFGTGLPPGAHGLLGYKVAIPGDARLMNQLRWDPYVPPREWQPHVPIMQRAAAAGLTVAQVSDPMFERTPLTQVALQGGTFVGLPVGPERIRGVLEQLSRPGPVMVYTYASDLDKAGHGNGVDSDAWRVELSRVDGMVRMLADQLPPETSLYVTADHGMIDVAPEDRIDVDTDPELSAGVALLGGEGRARHVYAVPGAASDVLAIWQDVLADSCWVLSRDEAITAGWFGPVEERVYYRIGDVVAAPWADVAIIASRREVAESRMVGLHGSMTAVEQLVPLLEVHT